MIKLIIFDYDGVIVDSLFAVYDIYLTIGKKLNVVMPATIDAFKKIYTDDFRECYRHLGIVDENQKKAVKIFKEELEKKTPQLFQGIREVLTWASHDYRLVLVSSNYTHEVIKNLENEGIRKYFALVEGNSAIDKSEKFGHVLKTFDVAPDEAIVIGDRTADLLSAQETNIKNVILVDYGYGYDRTKFHNQMTVNQPLDLISLIKAIDDK
ncbi:HAD family hydrolase [Sporolactobacillus sp. CQH2019]|uniref:HAD family hydrolase n=1 Tax=Sporolactobacillus sp. CQH2019 TaxID=3023512 RepID=UPI002368D116|nr:HAD family hydrolase [Sporolactobacillus sp. CQH2019]MDD9149098.1 HAD family hydrolase [Sporolactobacillus sp. CQH2019]